MLCNQIALMLSEGDFKKVKRLFLQGQPITWLYLGSNYIKLRSIEKKLGMQFKRMDIVRFHDEVAGNIREEHTRWIDDLNRTYGKTPEWWFNSIPSRNVYDSNLFQYCCYLEILDRIWKEKSDKPRLLIVESQGLAKSIVRWAAAKEIKVNFINYNKCAQQVSEYYLLSFLRWVKFGVTTLLRVLAAFVSQRMHGQKNINLSPCLILDTYVHNYCLTPEGVFKDRYFPYLHEYLHEKGIYVLIHPVLFGFNYNYFGIYSKMRKSNSYFIIQEDFLNIFDYINAFILPIKTLCKKIKAAPFRSLDLSDILKEEQLKKSVYWGMQAVLTYRLFLRLGKTGLRPNLFIDWYENQVIDKALVIGARKAFPETKILGAQMFIHSYNHLHTFPSQSEVEARVTPDLLLGTSAQQCLVAQSFTKQIPCKPAAALRFRNIFIEEEANLFSENKIKPVILVLLSFNVNEAVELLEVFKEVLPHIAEEAGILIKCHPDYEPKDIIRVFGRKDWPNRFQFFQGNLSEILKEASLVISSNSSSMIEAAAKGIPVIFLGRQTVLNHNLLANLNMDTATECFSAEELISAIQKYLTLTPIERNNFKKTGARVRNLFFTPVNDETLAAFLDSEGHN